VNRFKTTGRFRNLDQLLLIIIFESRFKAFETSLFFETAVAADKIGLTLADLKCPNR
jgi:hypothetical protein